MKPASEIDDDPDGKGHYYFFKGYDWLKYDGENMEIIK